jgi:hypothetical protein
MIDQEDKPIRKTLNPEYSYVSSAVGGSVSQVSFGDNVPGSQAATTQGESTKGSVRGLSRKSRRNLLRRMASINRTAFRAYEGRVFSIVLTYPSEYPEDPNLCKKHLKALRKRLKRKYGPFSAYWRLGIQKRGPGTYTCSSSCPLHSAQ